MVKRPYAPGAHGQTGNSRPKKQSEYGRQLLEKQKAKAIYGLRERQFRSCVDRAEKLSGNSAENLLKLLELRLDNTVYRLKLAVSRAQARQMVSHGLVKVNGKKVNIASYSIKEGDTVEPKVKTKYADIRSDGIPSWMELDPKKIVGQIKRMPTREEIDTPVNESQIIEFYSR